MSSSIVLPHKDYVVHHWKAGEGAFVTQGDIIAFVCEKNNSIADTTSGTVGPAVVTVAPSHRRPSQKRGRPVVAPIEESNESSVVEKEKASLIPIMAPTTGMLKKANSNQEELESLVIATITPCAHPAVMDNMCAVCGTSMSPLDGKDAPVMEQVTLSGGITMKVSETEAMSISQAQTERLFDQKKLSLVLDLDHTLVHATGDPRASKYDTRKDVRTLLLPTENGHQMHHHVKLRPHVKEFLLQDKFEMMVYTAGTRLYAEQITMILSRHIVGAELDHVDLLHLTHDVKDAEQELKARSAKWALEQDDTSSKQANGSETSGKEDGEDEPPKKRSRFVESAPDLKTDAMTNEKLEQLRVQLKEATDKENEALLMRQKIFGSRIVSRTDVGDLGINVKSLKRVFPCGGTMSIICDDREDVWANAKEMSNETPHNLLLVRPYHWSPFSGFADVNNAAGVDLTKDSTYGDKEGATEEADIETDQQLIWTMDILDRVHSRYYSTEGKKDVPAIVKEMRESVLQGCNIVLSGLVPLHKQREEYKGSKHPLLRYLISMGANISMSINASITHVVAASDGTEKIMQARRIPGCFIVKSSWVMESLWTLKRSDELQHLLGSPPLVSLAHDGEGQNGLGITTAATSVQSTDDDEEDEDFADELWE